MVFAITTVCTRQSPESIKFNTGHAYNCIIYYVIRGGVTDFWDPGGYSRNSLVCVLVYNGANNEKAYSRKALTPLLEIAEVGGHLVLTT